MTPNMSEKKTPTHASSRWTDLELVRGARAGQGEVVQEFLVRMRCVPRILAAMNARLRRPLPPEELEDIVQETLVAVWRKLSRYNGTSTLETWVYSFCHFELLKHLDRLRKRLRLRPLEVGTSEALTSPPSEGRVEYEHVHQSLESLETEVRDVIRLKYFEGLTLERIGKRLGISTNTVKTRYYRGLRRLGNLIRQRETPGTGREAREA